MKRMLALLMAGALVVGLLGGCARESAARVGSYKIAIVQHVDHPSLNEIRDSIQGELADSELGESIELSFHNANGDMNLLQSIMQNLVGEGMDMIVPIATPTAQAARAATENVPIVFSAVSNPVEAGLVKSFSETEENITGVSNSIPVQDILQMSQRLTPDAKNYGLVYNSSEINSTTGIQRAKEYLDERGLTYREATITGTADIHQAVSSLVGEVDAFFTPNDNTVASAMPTYVDLATEAGIPIYVGADSMVKDGGLATVGIDYTLLGRQTGSLITRIMEGESIAENPVEQIAEYSNMINMDTAKALNINLTKEIRDDFILIYK
ncbi:MAG: ABC transporter substrate-binding protein [Gudongella sp.]|nr:ABC transporter substrate-binding protein [Gudongella sp.]